MTTLSPAQADPLRQPAFPPPDPVARNQRIETFALMAAILGFATLFAAAQYLHPNPFGGLDPHDGEAYLAAFRHRPLLHFAHLLEFICGPLLIVLAAHFYGLARIRFPAIAALAFMMAATGAVMLIGNKAALCLTASAFDTLTDAELMALVPGLDVLVSRQALLGILWLLPLLPLGFVLFGALLWRAGLMPRWQAAGLFFGSLLLANPGVQPMNTAGATILAIALIPYGIGLRHRLSVTA